MNKPIVGCPITWRITALEEDCAKKLQQLCVHVFSLGWCFGRHHHQWHRWQLNDVSGLMKLLGQADSNTFRECNCTNCTSLERLVEAVLASAFNTYHIPNNVRIICLWDRRIHKKSILSARTCGSSWHAEMLQETPRLRGGQLLGSCMRKRHIIVTYLRSSVTLHAWQSSWPLHTSYVLYSVHGAEVAFGELSGRASCTPWHQKSLTTRPTKLLGVRVTRFKIRLVAVIHFDGTIYPFLHSAPHRYACFMTSFKHVPYNPLVRPPTSSRHRFRVCLGSI